MMHMKFLMKCVNLYKQFQRIPSKFAKANGLNKKCGLIIRDERQRSWNLKLYTSRSLVCVGGSWGKFCAANNIKAGDRLMFEVVTNGKKPIWKFHGKVLHLKQHLIFHEFFTLLLLKN